MASQIVAASPVHLSRSIGTRDDTKRIVLVGRNAFQNRLFKALLESRLEQPYEIVLMDSWPDEETIFDLCLWDGFAFDTEEIWSRLGLIGSVTSVRHTMALFNIDDRAGTSFEKEAVEKKIRGVFYRHETPELIAKGVVKILQGELWFSRKTTSELLLEEQLRRPTVVAAEAMLTAREKEILSAIASGAGNAEIAGEFFISPHTVKAHLYNIYRKINVNNRLEATLWVARYL
jgi:DNA-binding NarL/FixJ family response regulator